MGRNDDKIDKLGYYDNAGEFNNNIDTVNTNNYIDEPKSVEYPTHLEEPTPLIDINTISSYSSDSYGSIKKIQKGFLPLAIISFFGFFGSIFAACLFALDDNWTVGAICAAASILINIIFIYSISKVATEKYKPKELFLGGVMIFWFSWNLALIILGVKYMQDRDMPWIAVGAGVMLFVVLFTLIMVKSQGGRIALSKIEQSNDSTVASGLLQSFKLTMTTETLGRVTHRYKATIKVDNTIYTTYLTDRNKYGENLASYLSIDDLEGRNIKTLGFSNIYELKNKTKILILINPKKPKHCVILPKNNQNQL